LTFKDTSHSDLVAGQVWGRLGTDFYLLDYVAERMDFVTTLSAIRSMSAKWPRAKTILIEDAANGPAVVSVLRKELNGIVTFSPADYGSKEARVFAVSPTVEAGNVYLPLVQGADGSWSPAYFVEDFVRLCAMFPNAEHDDPVDAFTAAIIRMTGLRKKRSVTSQNYLQN
jgi:predicted phage terminase large subunit-like protein